MPSSNIKKNRFQILSRLPANASQNVTGRFQISLLILKPKFEFYHNFFATSHNSESKSAVLKKL